LTLLSLEVVRLVLRSAR